MTSEYSTNLSCGKVHVMESLMNDLQHSGEVHSVVAEAVSAGHVGVLHCHYLRKGDVPHICYVVVHVQNDYEREKLVQITV